MLSLEVKRFINSEHTGNYINIELPIEGEPVRKRRDGGGRARFVRPTIKAKMHFVEEGNGEPLILIHSIGQSLYTWRRMFPYLSQYYRVIAVDLLGHGYSDKLEPHEFGYSIADHAMSIELFMNAMGIRSSHFCAFSMGSAYLIQLALNSPQRMGRMVLLAPGGLVPEMPLAIRMIDNPLLGGVACMLYNDRTVEKILESCYFDLTNINDEVIDQYFRPASDNMGRRCIRYSLQGHENEALVMRLREVVVPTLILLGGEDKWRSLQEAEVYHTAIRGAGLSIIRNAGHLLHEEKAQRVGGALTEFIVPVEEL